jgi:hypothetical protein
LVPPGLPNTRSEHPVTSGKQVFPPVCPNLRLTECGLHADAITHTGAITTTGDVIQIVIAQIFDAQIFGAWLVWLVSFLNGVDQVFIRHFISSSIKIECS